jgi:hypothetical protein
MTISIKVVQSKKDLSTFIYFPLNHHKEHKNWVPPIFSEESAFYNPSKNKNLKTCENILAFAYVNGVLTGRIMGIINKHYNDIHNLKDARFYAVECINNQEILHELIAFVEKWAIIKGMNRLVGPYGFSDKDPQGFMIEGFDQSPVLATNFNYPYMIQLIENEGFSKEVDCFSYKINIPKSVPELYEKILARTLKNNRLKLLDFKCKRSMKKYIVPVFRLINEAYSPLYGFVPLDEEEMAEIADKYFLILDIEFIKVIIDENNDVAAFIIALPDMGKGIIKAKGKLFPFGFFHILRSAKKTNQLNLMLGAVKEKYRNLGLDALLGKNIIESAKKRKMTIIDSHLILENNLRMNAELEKLGGTIYKKYRVFQKNIS